MVDYLVFKASTNVKNLIGKDLVTDPITAVFELVKNAYDADASRVDIEFQDITTVNGKIIIRDNGTGMDLSDVKKYWMVIGTDSKKDKGESPKFRRALNGDKGVGRFSVDRLGKKLLMSAVKEESYQEITLNVNWVDFEKRFDDLSQVHIPYTLLPTPNRQAGVKLEISGLRDEWNKSAIEKLIKSLRHFKSPFLVGDDFEIVVHAHDYFNEEIPINPYHLEDMSNLWVKTEVGKDDPSKISITILRDGIEYKEQHQNPFNFGAILAQIYFFDTSAKLKFNRRMNMRVIEFGNIRLYRDEFRIHPYGEKSNDWLELDRRKVQGFARSFGTRELVGFVQITKKYNTGIEVLTNRQGLIENTSYEELRKFIFDYCVKFLEKYYFKKPKNEVFEKSNKNVENAVVELQQVVKDLAKSSPETAQILKRITEVVQKSQSEQTNFVRAQQELLSVYKRVASKEVLLHQIIHQALIRIERIKSVSSSGRRIIEDYEEYEEEQQTHHVDRYKAIDKKFVTIDNLTDDAKDYLMKARDYLIRKKNKQNISINIYAQDLMGTFAENFAENNILTKIESDEVDLSIDKEDLQTIFENFISNSIKSLKQVDSRSREFMLKIVNNPQMIIIIFKDNGVGIPLHLRDRIFDPFFSTTNSFGMGLAIVDEIIKEYKGELNLAINDDVGAEFQIKIRK